MLFSLILSAHLVLERQRVELARGREGGVDHRLRHAVAGQVEEADVLAGVPHLRRDGLESAGLAAEGGREVDHRDRPRRLLDAPHRHRLEDVHRVTGQERNRVRLELLRSMPGHRQASRS